MSRLRLVGDCRKGEQVVASSQPAAPSLPRLPSDLSILDRSAFAVAFEVEIERADPKEAAWKVAERAMVRVRRVIEARQQGRL